MKSSNAVNVLPLTGLFLSINRGLIALFAGGRVSTQLLYYGVTIFGISVSLMGMIRKNNQIVGGGKLYRILLVNLLVYIYWIATELTIAKFIEIYPNFESEYKSELVAMKALNHYHYALLDWEKGHSQNARSPLYGVI